MNDSDPLASLTNFVFSLYGALTLIGALGLFALLWSDQIKRRWYDRIERKKWEQWNGPKARKATRAIDPDQKPKE